MGPGVLRVRACACAHVSAMARVSVCITAMRFSHV